MVGTALYFFPMIKGSGIPQAEAAARGLIHLKWYQALPAMAASSLFCVFLGMQIGVEGPSIFIGGMCGEGASKMFRSSRMENRYQITAGASAAMAVAFNAPLTGIIFALEEAHRKFTPQIFICAFSSVATAVITKQLLFKAMDMVYTGFFTNFVLVTADLNTYGFTALAAVVCALLGAGFYKLARASRKLMLKITALKGIVRLLIPFLFVGAAGLVTVYAMGSGQDVINKLSTHGGTTDIALQSIFSSPIVVTLLIIIALRVISTCINVGAGVPGGIFVPILAIGASLGALLSKLFVPMGMGKQYCDLMVFICMSVFFATTVKAPLTAIVLVMELNYGFVSLVPVILAVAIGYMVSQALNVPPLYEALMEDLIEEHSHRLKKFNYNVAVEAGSPADGSALRDVLWPESTYVMSVRRDGKQLVPSADMVLYANDKLVINGNTESLQQLKEYVDEIVQPTKRLLHKHKHEANTTSAVINIGANITEMSNETPVINVEGSDLTNNALENIDNVDNDIADGDTHNADAPADNKAASESNYSNGEDGEVNMTSKTSTDDGSDDK